MAGLFRDLLLQLTGVVSPRNASIYERIKAKKGGGNTIIATARKFLGDIYRTLKNNWVFADFSNFVLAED